MRLLPLLTALPLLLAAPAHAATPYDVGTPNVPSARVPAQGRLWVKFGHRYNVATFPNLAAPVFEARFSPLPRLQLGVAYSSLVLSLPDFEPTIRYQLLDQRESFLSLTPRLSYTSSTRGFLGEITASRHFGPLGLGLTYRAFTRGLPAMQRATVVGLGALGTGQPPNGAFMHAAGLGATLEILPDFMLMADAVLPFDKSVLQLDGFAWSVGIVRRIPDSPHTFTIFAGRMQAGTSQGQTFAPLGGADMAQHWRVGFEFTANVRLYDIEPAKPKDPPGVIYPM